MNVALNTFEIAGDRYAVRPLRDRELADRARWRQLDDHGRWSSEPVTGAIVGEWISDSPSLFFDQRIEGDYIWQVRVARLKPDAAFLARFAANKHAQGCDPRTKYNFNLWLRADSPPGSGENFLQAYPKHLGTGWNGMGDDHWQSLFNTVVWNGPSTGHALGGLTNWVRLRKSPGYVQVCEAIDVVPHLPYDQPHLFTFAVSSRLGRVRMYYDACRVYDYADAAIPGAGYLGLCVWLCVMRFDQMRLYQWMS
ncbi:MAG: hypothetical protein WD042_19295 [Phycisphaeraceae bacterium]